MSKGIVPQLQKLFKEQNYTECANLSIQQLNNNPQDKHAHLFLANSQLKLEDLDNC